MTDAEIVYELKRLVAPACERCGRHSVQVVQRPCMTAYADPQANRALKLCPECAEEYFDYWKEMWAEARA